MINLKEIRDKKLCIAVVGASDNEEKYGFKVFSYLKNKGFNVFPINNKKKIILGDKSFANVSELSEFLSNKDENIFLIDMVVPPKVTIDILNEAIRCNIKKVWFQPGSESSKAIEMCKENKIEFIYHSCIMEESKDTNIKFHM